MNHNPYTIYHSSYTNAVTEALRVINETGYTVSDDEWFYKVSNSKKPGEGVTTRFNLELESTSKKPKYANVQVYNRGNDVGNNMELNFYFS